MENTKNILIFEGAGNTPRNNLENCRIRTRLQNNEGKILYVEIIGIEVNEKDKREIYKNYKFVGHIDFCFENDCNEISKYRKLENNIIEYSKEEVLKLVNKKLNCSFKDIKVINDNSIRVHDTKDPLCISEKRKYNKNKKENSNIDNYTCMNCGYSEKDKEYCINCEGIEWIF